MTLFSDTTMLGQMLARAALKLSEVVICQLAMLSQVNGHSSVARLSRHTAHNITIVTAYPPTTKAVGPVFLTTRYLFRYCVPLASSFAGGAKGAKERRE